MIVNTPEDFVDYVMDELGRWAAENCPIMFKARAFQTSLFSHLYEGENNNVSPLNVKFTKNGFVVVRVIRPDESYVVARFQVANPKLRDNMLVCFEKLDDEDYGGFVNIEEARTQWRR